MKRQYLRFVVTGIAILALAGTSRPHNTELQPRYEKAAVEQMADLGSSNATQDDPIRMFLSTQLKADPGQMDELEEIKAGDSLYFVVKINPGFNYTIGDLSSTDPKTNEKNIFVCFDMNSYVGNVCTGVLPSPVSAQDLSRKSAVLTLIPATNEMGGENAATVKRFLYVIASKMGADFDMRITYQNFDNGKSASFKAPFVMTNYMKSRWYQYNQLFQNQEAAADKQKELDTVEPPPSTALEPAAARQLLGLAQNWYGSESRIFKAYFIVPQWYYVKNDYGILMARTADIAILRKDLNTGDCLVDRTLYARQEYISANTWAPSVLQRGSRYNTK